MKEEYPSANEQRKKKKEEDDIKVSARQVEQLITIKWNTK